MTKPRSKSRKRQSSPAVSATADLDSDDTAAKDLELVAEWLDAQEQWESAIAAAPYDGIFGTLPDWIPHGINSEFVRIRNNLLRSSVEGEKITRGIALTWIDRYSKLGETDEDTYIPSNVFEIVGQLARWRWIVSLGPKLGAAELGIPDAAVVAHAKRFVARKGGAIEPETKFLQELIKAKPYERTEGLWRELRRLLGIPEDLRSINGVFCPFSIRFDGAKMVVLKRGKTYPRKTFANAISRLRQENKNTR